jgi:hypothetical protein
VFLQRIWNAVVRILPNDLEARQTLVFLSIPLVIITLVAVLVINVNNYFFVYANAPSVGPDLPLFVGRQIKSDSSSDHVYLYGEGIIDVLDPTVRFISGGAKATDLHKIEDLPPLPADGKGLTIIVVGQHIKEIPALQTHYNQGVVVNIKDPLGRDVFSKFHIASTP